MHRNDGYHPDHPITCRQVTLLRLAVDALPRDELALAALFGSHPNPPTREEYARLYALLIRAADQGGTFDLERVCGCCADNQCGCDGTALRPAYGSQLSAQPHCRETPVTAAPAPLAACGQAPGREHHPALLPAGTGENGTCNCQEPGPGESDERTCRNCGYPLSEAQRRELGRSAEPGG